MIDDENHPAMILAHQELLRRLGIALDKGKYALDRSLLEKLYGVIKDHRAEYRKAGLDFPVLVALAVPRLGIIDFVRADLDISSIKTKIVNFVREHRAASMDEIVTAFRIAFPALKPDFLMDVQQTGTQANERQDERYRRNQLGRSGEADEEFGGEGGNKLN